jgi:transcriptional antiterminator NusG
MRGAPPEDAEASPPSSVRQEATMYNDDKEPAAAEPEAGLPESAPEQGDEERPSEDVKADAEPEGGTEAAQPEDAEASETDEAIVEEEAPVSRKTKPKAAGKRGAKKTSGKASPKRRESAAKKPSEDAVVAEAEEGEPENKLPMKWYAIHTYSGHENKVKENIVKMAKTSGVGDQFGRLIVPTEEVAEMRKGKKTITTRKYLPGYILIEMFMSEESWHLVNSIPGVTSFVGTGTTPQPVAESEMERVLGRMDKERETIVPEIPFTLGEHIRIKDGPFSDFTGIIDEINTEKGKLRVLVSIFGRETPVELDFLEVEPI